MGLDISCYPKIKKVTDPKSIEEHDYDFEVEKESDPYGYTTDIEDGCYKGEGNCHYFGAGSYSGYNKFRGILCQAIHGVTDEKFWEKFDDKYSESSFAEFINFSDCEGYIGSKVSKKLHEDFVNNKQKFVDYLNETFGSPEQTTPYYVRLYDDFTKGFQLASEEGVVLFR